MEGMLQSTHSSNQNISSWDVSKVINMKSLFAYSTFIKDISSWDVGSVTDMSNMFKNSDFNQDLNTWDVSEVTNMLGMFMDADVFNGNISAWDVGKVEEMNSMFRRAYKFNQAIGNWNVINVRSMVSLFSNATVFDQDISTWNVSNTWYMQGMFDSATAFNQDISMWDVGNAVNLSGMFSNATSFDQNLGAWDISEISNLPWEGMNNIFENITLSAANYDATLIGWATLDTASGETQIPTNVTFGAGNSQYCNSTAERISLINDFGWTITDAGENCSLSVDDENLSQAKIIPNPTTGKFRIDGLQEDVDIVIYDINGKEIFKQNNYNTGFIDSNQLSQGIYFVKITNNHLNFSKKLIIK